MANAGLVFGVFGAALAIARRRFPHWPMAQLGATLAVIGLTLCDSHVRIAEIDRLRAVAPALKIGIVQGNLSRQDAADPRELLMDVQRYGADAEVIAPPALREQMREMLVGALGRYG